MAAAQFDTRSTITKLNENNYQTWKFAIMMALKQVNLWRYVTGEATLPESASLDHTAKFEAEADKAMSMLALSVEDSQFVHISDCKSAKEIWDTLKAIYEPKSLARVLMLRKQFVNIKLEPTETMNSYINRIKVCSEQYREAGGTLQDTEVAYTMMNGLPDSYDSLVMSIGNTTDMKLSSADVKKALLIEYDRRIAKHHDVSKREVFQATRGGRSQVQPARDMKSVKCFKCGNAGHYARNCKKSFVNQRDKSRSQKTSEKFSNAYDSAFYMCVELNQADYENSWVLDSGGTHHVCKHREWFYSFNEIHPDPIKTADGSVDAGPNQLYVYGIGNIKMSVKVGEQKFEITMHGVYYAPQVRRNLMSVAQIEKKGKTLTFRDGHVDIFDEKSRKVVAQAIREENLYVIRGEIITSDSHAIMTNTVTVKQQNIDLWHHRFCHVNYGSIRRMANSKMVRGLKSSSLGDETICDSCCLAKSTKAPCKRLTSPQSSSVAELIHSDLCGPLPVRSIGGARYFLTCIDDFSRKITVYCLKTKDEVHTFLKRYIVEVERQTGRKIKRFRTDNGLEFCNTILSELFSELGVKHERTNVETPQMNGVAERANRTIMDLVRSSLQSAKLPQKFWAETVVTVAYILNRVPHSSLKNTVPEAVWTGHPPSVRHLRSFGCLAYAHLPSQNRRKLDMRARRCILVGYATHTRGYRLWDPIRKDVIQTKHVRFDETRIGHEAIYGHVIQEDNPNDVIYGENRALTIPVPTTDQMQPEVDDNDRLSSARIDPDIATPMAGHKHETTRTTPPLTRSRAATMKESGEHPHHIHLNLAITAEPTTIEEALESPQAPLWKAAIEDELQTLERRKTWEIVNAPVDKQLIGCRWIFKVKTDASGENQQYRARLVAQGFSQKEGIDYQETYSPVASFSIIRLLPAIAAISGWTVCHIDIKCAYLYGELEEQLYMKLLPGYNCGNTEGKVAKLLRPIYGLKQSGRNWNSTFDKTLQENGFKRLLSSSCVYVYDSYTILVIYVDDIVIFGKSSENVNAVTEKLQNLYEIKNLGNVSYLLGIKIERDENGYFRLSQSGYIQSILKRFQMSDCRPASTPLENGIVLSKRDCPTSQTEKEDMRNVPYRELVGSLMHLAVSTRPDILFSVVKLSQFNSNPGRIHWEAAKRVLRYLSLTKNYQLIVAPKSEQICLYSDADWASDIDDRRSFSGLVVMLGECPVLWKSRKQNNISTSTMEAEYCALAQATKEAVWLSTFIKELNMSDPFVTPYILMCDNKSAIDFSRNRTENSRTKHIDIAYHITRKNIEEGLIDLKFVPSVENVADILTKGLGKKIHQDIVSSISLKESQRG